jgi:hypothetical protein
LRAVCQKNPAGHGIRDQGHPGSAGRSARDRGELSAWAERSDNCLLVFRSLRWRSEGFKSRRSSSVAMSANGYSATEVETLPKGGYPITVLHPGRCTVMRSRGFQRISPARRRTHSAARTTAVWVLGFLIIGLSIAGGCRSGSRSASVKEGRQVGAASGEATPAGDYLSGELATMADEDQRRAAYAMEGAQTPPRRHRDSPLRPPPRRP